MTRACWVYPLFPWHEIWTSKSPSDEQVIIGRASPVEAREQAAENQGTSRQSERPSRDAGADTSTNDICRRGDTLTNKICRGGPRAAHEQDRITNETV